MSVVTREEYEKFKKSLFHHFVNENESTGSSIGPSLSKRDYIDFFFRRLIKENKPESSSDYDFDRRIRVNEDGIPLDPVKMNLLKTRKERAEYPATLGHIPTAYLQRFEYAACHYHDFVFDHKFSEIRKLREKQRQLPIAERKEELISLLKENQVVIIAGDTGCGKSTQVPQYLLEAGYTGIACTQPRRIACTALAKRVSYETLDVYGSDVAYQIRFETTKSKRTRMLFVTEGVLLRQIEGDPLLQQYNVVILDEVHERNLDSDLLIGLLKDLMTKRDDIKVILMSATINLELFTNYFEGAPVIQVPGRLFPIAVKWRPIKMNLTHGSKKDHNIDPEPYLRVLELIDKEVKSDSRGDVLIFMNGVTEMTKVAETLKTYAETTNAWIILLLHSDLSTEEQDKVFDIPPAGVRKCILSTNIAETSVTIDGIRFVIDSGKVNLIKYEAGSEAKHLEEFWVSKASANQRKGRAGRTGPGVCYRLYSQDQYDAFDNYTPSEINRVSLQGMVLKLIALNLGLDPRTFQFIEKPPKDAISSAIETLKYQNVIQLKGNNLQLTALGKTLSKLPVEVDIGKMLVLGCVIKQIDVMLTVAAGMSVQGIFPNRSYQDHRITEKRSVLSHRLGDQFTLINVFRAWVEKKTRDDHTRSWIRENGIDEGRLLHLSKLRLQYRKVLEEAGLIAKKVDPDAEDSRMRRIEQGEKRKLNEMRNAERNRVRKKKVMNSRKHYDTIMDEEIDEEAETKMETDVKSAEFMLSHKQMDVEKILSTHRLRDREANMIAVIIAMSLYPNYAALDMANKYRAGQEIFVHTRLKPFTLLHPHSSITEYHLETLDPSTNSQGLSRTHQVLFYSLLLKTKKPYILNVLPLPILYLALIAKKVECKDETTIVFDEFLDVQLSSPKEREEILLSAVKFRKEMNNGLATKLVGEKFDTRELENILKNISSEIHSDDRKFYLNLKRNVVPSDMIIDPGVYLPDGTIELDDDLDELIRDRNSLEEPDHISYSFREHNNDEAGASERTEKTPEPEKKETYYDIMRKRQQAREAEEAKRPKAEPI